MAMTLREEQRVCVCAVCVCEGVCVCVCVCVSHTSALLYVSKLYADMLRMLAEINNGLAMMAQKLNCVRV